MLEIMDNIKFLKWFSYVLFFGGSLIMIGYVIYYTFVVNDYPYPYVDAIIMIFIILGVFVFPMLLANYITSIPKEEGKENVWF